MKFRTALVLSVTLLLALVIFALLGGVSNVVESYARQSVERDLARSRRLVTESWRLREAVHRAESQRLAEDPRLRAVVATEEIDRATILGVAEDVARAIEADLFLLVDDAGRLLADTNEPEAGGDSLMHLPLVRETLEKGLASGLWTSGEAVFQVQGCRMAFGQTVVGAVVFGRKLAQTLAEDIYEQTGMQVAIMLAEATVTTSAQGHVPALGGEPFARLKRAEAGGGTAELTLAGTPYIASSVVAARASDGRELRFVLLRSMQEAFELGRRLQTIITYVAGFGLFASIVLALLLARGLSGPLEELVQVVGRIGRGDLTARARPSSMHETRTLAEAMNKMTAELEESRAQMETKQRLEREMEIANVLQTAMLPRKVEAKHLEIATRMVPASEVGGDYYDVIPTGDACWIGIGDVAGHGLPAGIVMMMMQTAVAALVRESPERSPASAVVALNQLLFHNVRERLQTSEHATFTLFRHDGGGHFRFAGAHESFLVYRHATETVERVKTVGTWLAIAEHVDACTEERSITLEPGDTMVLLTDGMTEAVREQDGEMFGLERLMGALRDLGRLDRYTVDEVLQRLFDAVDAWAKVHDDDRTLVVVRYTGGEARA